MSIFTRFRLNTKTFMQLFAYVLIWLSIVAVMTVNSLIKTGSFRSHLRAAEIEALIDWRNLAIFGMAGLLLVAMLSIVHRTVASRKQKRTADDFVEFVLDELGSSLFNVACGLAVGVMYVGMSDKYLVPALVLAVIGYWFKSKKGS